MTDTIIFLSLMAVMFALIALHHIGIGRFFHVISAAAFGLSRAWQAAEEAYRREYSDVMGFAPETAYRVRVRKRGEA